MNRQRKNWHMQRNPSNNNFKASFEHNSPAGRVAVITRTKDRPVMLERCAESVLGQTYKNWVHVIVNDGGNPTTVELTLAPFRDKYAGRLRVIHNPQSVGMQNASNIGIKATDSEFLVIHDDDDTWYPDFLRSCVDFLSGIGPDAQPRGVVTHTTWVIEEVAKDGTIHEISTSPYFPPDQITLFQMASRNEFPPIAFLYRRDMHGQVGLFNEDFTVMGDWDFNLRFLQHSDIGIIPIELARYHWRQSRSSSYANTVTAGLDEHQRKTTQMRNHYLRRDLQAGRFGLGYLMNISEQLNSHENKQEEMLKVLHNNTETTNTTLHHAEHLVRITSDLARLWRLKKLAVSMSKYCGSLARKLHAKLPDVKKKNGNRVLESTDELLKQATQGKVLSVDVFDTALRRSVESPHDVFSCMQDDVRHIANAPELDFRHARIAAERLARRRKFERHGTHEVTIADIYRVFCESVGVSDNKIPSLIELECEYEQRLCYPCPQVSEICRHAEDHGLAVIYTSDMYLPAETIKKMLADNGYKVSKVLVSSEHGQSKHTGELYNLLTDITGCQPAEITHIGDNFHADYTQALQKGLKAWHWRGNGAAKTFIQQSKVHTADTADTLSSLYTGIAAQRQTGNGPGDIWDKIGWEIVGPLYYSFIRWILNTARKDGIQKLFLLSRDGYYLQKAIEIIDPEGREFPQMHYMYASRRLLNLPAVHQLTKQQLDFLLTPNPGLTVANFFERLHLDPAKYAEEIHRAGFASANRVITTSHGIFENPDVQQQMHNLFRTIEPEILQIAKVERDLLYKYFDEIGFDGQASAVVDIGWQASSLLALQNLLRIRGHEPDLQGYYFATWNFAEKSRQSGCSVKSFYMHMGEPGYRREILGACPELIEFFFGAPHPTIIGLQQGRNGIEPLYDTPELSAAQEKNLEKVREAALRFIAEVNRCCDSMNCSGTGLTYLDKVLHRLLCNPSKIETEALGNFMHRDGFGNGSPARPLIHHSRRFPFKSQHKLREDYSRSYWKQGFRTSLSDRERRHIE